MAHHITGRWTEHLRRKAKKTTCRFCDLEFPSQHGAKTTTRAELEHHLEQSHLSELGEDFTEEEKKDWIVQEVKNALEASERDGKNVKTAAPGEIIVPIAARQGDQKRHVDPDSGPPASGTVAHPGPGRATSTSPARSLKREGSRSRDQSPPKKSKARLSSTAATGPATESDRRPPAKGKLWSPDDDTGGVPRRSYDKANVATNQRLRVSSTSTPKQPQQRQSTSSRAAATQPENEEPGELIKQPETRPISQDQLVAEVKGIYAGLVMVESKCIEVDNAQNSNHDPANKLNNDQWQALIALHRTLLHEHHDFFLASQHPSASPALRRLASKYAMPARMWRHGIHSFLELLRHRLPASLEHMLMFIYLAYSMMALLYETVPAFEDTWIECLGDLSRYRMAIEDDDIRDRENWTAVSRHWYSKASDKAPTTGRLYHHLAILARPNASQQLYYYAKSLCVAIPFVSARESIKTLFDPTLAPTPNQQQARLQPTEFAFIKAHGIMFSGKFHDQLSTVMSEFLESLNGQIARTQKRWLEQAYYVGIANSCALVGYGTETNPLFKAIQQVRQDDELEDQPMQENDVESAPTPKELVDPMTLFTKTFDVVSRRFGDNNVLPYLHVTLVFLYHLTFCPDAMAIVEKEFPWKLTALMLNALLDSYKDYVRIEGEELPQSESVQRPLPEDYAMRGLLWAEKVFPSEWFANDKIDDDEKYFEMASMAEERKERILWLGCRIAAAAGAKWLRYDSQAHKFTTAPKYDIELDMVPMPMTPSKSVEMGELPDAIASA
ncbi:EST/SMG-like protein 1 [Podospora australis]|uniref:EST/SMG-like protein 1 n=1 Tax=Podospora australis TaxID=1536484 RepID=A0AAN7AKW1_9PEZI|nr:EST/SMG-like protein 1 [Podospora australis]